MIALQKIVVDRLRLASLGASALLHTILLGGAALVTTRLPSKPATKPYLPITIDLVTSSIVQDDHSRSGKKSDEHRAMSKTSAISSLVPRTRSNPKSLASRRKRTPLARAVSPALPLPPASAVQTDLSTSNVAPESINRAFGDDGNDLKTSDKSSDNLPGNNNNRKTVDSGVASQEQVGRLLVSRRPIYPRQARLAGWDGTVVLRILIDSSGKPATVTVSASSGHQLLDEAALDSVKKWRFLPALKSGHPIAVFHEVRIRYRLDEE